MASGRFGATLDWLGVLGTKTVDGFYEHASLPGAASRLFRENRFAESLAEASRTPTAALVLGVARSRSACPLGHGQIKLD